MKRSLPADAVAETITTGKIKSPTLSGFFVLVFKRGDMYPISFFKQRKKPGTPEKKEALGERASAVASSLIPPNPLLFFQPHETVKEFLLSAP